MNMTLGSLSNVLSNSARKGKGARREDTQSEEAFWQNQRRCRSHSAQMSSDSTIFTVTIKGKDSTSSTMILVIIYLILTTK